MMRNTFSITEIPSQLDVRGGGSRTALTEGDQLMSSHHPFDS